MQFFEPFGNPLDDREVFVEVPDNSSAHCNALQLTSGTSSLNSSNFDYTITIEDKAFAVRLNRAGFAGGFEPRKVEP